jgi:hypothetical protein
MGLGKTYSAMEAIADAAGPPPEVEEFLIVDRSLLVEDFATRGVDELLAEDLSYPRGTDGGPRCFNQIVFAAQRHDILEEAAGFLSKLLLERGWSKAHIDANIVIGQSRERGLCLRNSDEVKMVTQAHGDLGPSLCVDRRTGIKCPFFHTCEDHGWLAMKKKMATARFVFLTHAHLFSPWPPNGSWEKDKQFHPKNAKLVIVDENFISSAIESEPTNIKEGTFRTLLSADLELVDRERVKEEEKKQEENPELDLPALDPEDLPKLEMPEKGLGNLIEDALATPEPLKILREAGVTGGHLRAAAAYRESRERRRKIGDPSMTMPERQAFLDRTEKNAKRKPHVTKISHLLRRLARELQTGRDECYSLRLMKSKQEGHYIRAQGRADLWDTTLQKWIFLDGTAAVSEVRSWFLTSKRSRSTRRGTRSSSR